MSNKEQNTEAAAPARGGKKGLVIGLVVALVAVLGVGGYAMLRMRHGAAGGATAQAAAPKPQPAMYLPLDPPFVVNFQTKQSPSYLQVGVTLMAHDAAAIKAAKDADPVVRNALVMLFSAQSATDLATTAGKQKLRAEALKAVQKVVQERLGRPGIDALYFTSFVMQ
ncbi:flagellar basal body-associated FliL family protein [Dyella sp. A6]|uniref:flagellar basal body-associated FliL family protein n=1 Tax=Dyella aluminiiresistens TaxID=3069105 RepID=UPI002E7A4400|nr:flagellar basal body-associated FliL family protein [Dyella sp. A6]